MKPWTEYDWSDLPPIPIVESDTMLARIAYTEEFRSAMSQLRAVMAKKEYSERALALTGALIEMSPSHYSVWDYRLDIVKRIGNDVFDYKTVGLCPSASSPPPIGEDGQWLNEFTLANAKTYQVWGYRAAMVQPNNDDWYRGELLVVKTVLEDDPKNFHAWSHLKWAISDKPSAFRAEDLFRDSENGINEDVYNNSCWSFRFFVLKTYPELLNISAETAVVANQISQAPDNESAWSYFQGIYDAFGTSHDFHRNAESIARMYPNCPRALEVLAGTTHDPKEADEIYAKLLELEPVRSGLWNYRRRQLAAH